MTQKDSSIRRSNPTPRSVKLGSPKLGPNEVTALIELHFPQVYAQGEAVTIEAIDHDSARLRWLKNDSMLRPGGTVSGPTMFKLADLAVYAAILGALGEQALQAVTTSMTINFLRRPMPADLIAHVRIIKLGRRLAVADVEIYSDGEDEMIAHATSTYSIPSAPAGT